MDVSATSIHNCYRFVLHASQRSYSPGVEGSGNYSTAIKRYSCSYPIMSSVFKQVFLMGTGLLLVVFLPMFTCCKAVVFMLAFASWLLSLVVGPTMTKIRKLIGSGGLSRATNWGFLDGAALTVKLRVIL